MLHTIQDHITEIETNPEIGARLSLFSICVGFIFNLTKEGHLNPLIMDVLQAGAWVTGMVVGFFTIIGYLKKLTPSIKKYIKKKK